ncbi:CatB-related O-acetyltransferase [Phaeobacter sp. 22II1-1F12B]|uniref:CatB-related O-acetyltransferase n=1 Tax=Phaeobacter sp. 22II1-1F12B TaxID=1317111 RepID=UPI000B51EF56|nr:CatB-related O-acetyltransferase [Phaeobacter sp. 22II1-1F12B]OWU71601.1 acetyltransferase [Phaeobacter sp. 22II1-1F12B]
MSRRFPDPTQAHPITLPDGTVHRGTVFLNRVIDHPNIEIGDYTYYSDFDEVADYAQRIAPYLFPGSGEKLIVGRFCQIAHGARFITASANHPVDGFSTFPFSVFYPEGMGDYAGLAEKWGDTVVGNDVWIGYGAMILPGVTIGDGAIIGAGSVVNRDVPAYAVMGGNPAVSRRMRFAPETVEKLLAIAWWNWPDARIEAHRSLIESTDIDALERAARG